MQYDPAEGILAAAQVLDALYSKHRLELEPLVKKLRTFAETEEEHDMMPDELARTVIDRERARLQRKHLDAAVGRHLIVPDGPALLS